MLRGKFGVSAYSSEQPCSIRCSLGRRREGWVGDGEVRRTWISRTHNVTKTQFSRIFQPLWHLELYQEAPQSTERHTKDG